MLSMIKDAILWYLLTCVSINCLWLLFLLVCGAILSEVQE